MIVRRNGIHHAAELSVWILNQQVMHLSAGNIQGPLPFQAVVLGRWMTGWVRLEEFPKMVPFT
jgi:hypothetical protein